MYAFKEIVNIYKHHSSPIFVCFLDASKAFDKINHWLLFNKLIKRNVPLFFVKLLVFWYSSQKVCVQWGNVLSDSFTVTNGVKQGGILSPILFNIYMNDLSVSLNNSRIGCNVNDFTVNHFIYADDMCVVAPCANGLQKLLDICSIYAEEHDILYNSKKSVCMYIKSKKYQLRNVPNIRLGKNIIRYVESYKYLGCILNQMLNDNDDIKRTLRGIYARSNILIRKFYNCTSDVKMTLFQAYCTHFYCTQLWWNYSKQSLGKVRVAFNNSFRHLMGYDRRCSASGMFVNAHIDSFNTLRRKCIYRFTNRLELSQNMVLRNIYNYRCLFILPSVREFYESLHNAQSYIFLH